MNTRALVLLMFAACAAACGRVAPAGDGGGAALMKNLLRTHALEIVAEERELHDALERAAARLRAAGEARRFDAVVTEGHPGLGRATPRIVVGTRKSNRAWLLAERTGVVMSRDDGVPSFRFGSDSFWDESEAFVATFEDPERPGLPVTLVFANDAGTAAALCANLDPAWKPWLRVMHGLQVVREERLHVDGSPYPFESLSGARARAAREAGLAPVSSGPAGIDVRAASGIAPDVLARYLGACGRALERAHGWIGGDAPRAGLSLRVWSRAAEYVVDGDAGALSSCDPILSRTDALILGSCDDGGAGTARMAAWKVLGAPAEPWMCDAAGVEAAWSWWGRELDPWLARVSGGGAPKLDEIVAADATERVSVHVISPLRAAFWRFLRETRGDEVVRGLWRGTRPLETGPEENAAFADWLGKRVAAAHIDHEPRREAARAHDRDFKMLHGVGLSEFEPASVSGFAVRDLDGALDEAEKIGTDAVLVTAYAVERPVSPEIFGQVQPSLVSPREGDVRIAAALFAGSQRGLRTILAANLLAGGAGTWSGAWTRGPESDWTAFFGGYARFVEHHAALAELTGATVLSVGTGLAGVTGAAPTARRLNELEAVWKKAGWSRVIAVARRTFSGLLTYTAGSELELERAPFFGELDFVALEVAPTLELDNTNDGADARGEIGHRIDMALSALERKARETSKRILFTEVCFSPALEGAARRYGSGHTSVDWHAQQYLDFAERLKTWSGMPLVAGVFAWRLGTGGAEPDYAPVIDTPRVSEAVRVLFQSLPAAH
jgi:hypothetical protein